MNITYSEGLRRGLNSLLASISPPQPMFKPATGGLNLGKYIILEFRHAAWGWAEGPSVAWRKNVEKIL